MRPHLHTYEGMLSAYSLAYKVKANRLQRITRRLGKFSTLSPSFVVFKLSDIHACLFLFLRYVTVSRPATSSTTIGSDNVYVLSPSIGNVEVLVSFLLRILLKQANISASV